jgi:hypothetical protein
MRKHPARYSQERECVHPIPWDGRSRDLIHRYSQIDRRRYVEEKPEAFEKIREAVGLPHREGRGFDIDLDD